MIQMTKLLMKMMKMIPKNQSQRGLIKRRKTPENRTRRSKMS